MHITCQTVFPNPLFLFIVTLYFNNNNNNLIRVLLFQDYSSTNQCKINK